MMVTFISQCEKKALRRSRRVLDSFADRIGGNTWQTVITNEGLSAVKKLLKKTASKNTAVSCFWIKSRSRSQLVWVVGNTTKFNKQGLTPVNTTSCELIMDKEEVQICELLANSAEQPLAHHLFAVGYVAFSLAGRLVNTKSIAVSAFIAGCFHDLGKLDPQFQLWLTKKLKGESGTQLPDNGVHIERGRFSFENHPRHNEISVMLYSLLVKGDDLNKRILRNHIPHTIYWHHTKPYRKIGYKTLKDIFKKFSGSLKADKIEHIYDKAIALIEQIATLANGYDASLPSLPDIYNKLDMENIDGIHLPPYKSYSEHNEELNEYDKEINENGINNLVRASVISADRAISALSKNELLKHLDEGTLDHLVDTVFESSSTLQENITSCLQGFRANPNNAERNQKQSIAADQLANIKIRAAMNDGMANVTVLQGPAGCGKSKIALEWAVKTGAKKILWICPRVHVCLGLYNDLSQEEYLPLNRIEIFTGEYKRTKFDGSELETNESEYFSGDVVITTIDQAVNAIISHGQVTALIELMNAHVVFDEFHELIPMPAFNLLFSELIQCKKMRGSKADTILISATPNYLFVEKVLGIHPDECVSVPSFNNSEYVIKFEIYDELSPNQNTLLNQPYSDNTFVITNTARDAQIGFIEHLSDENAILLHSKYTKLDKLYLFEQVMENFCQSGKRQFDVLRSGPIVQASLNITCDRMLTEFTNAENWLQRLGRLDRFNENDTPNEYTTVLAQSIASGKQTTNTARFLNQQFSWNSAKAWHTFLADRIDDAPKTLNYLYEIYRDFYQDKTSRIAIVKDLKAALTKSTQLINLQVVDPVSTPPKNRRNGNKIKIKKHSLRGNNRFVQMAVCFVSDDGVLKFPNQYAYDEGVGHALVDNSLTASAEEVMGYGDSDKDLLAYMKAKHHNIKDSATKVYKNAQLLELARSPETPIYLSYTPGDLEGIGGVAHSFAIYYALSDKQPIGSISINNLNKEGK